MSDGPEVKVIAHDLFTRLIEDNGNHYVDIEFDKTEDHHATCRADARKYARQHLGSEWEIGAFLGTSFCYRADGYPAYWRRYSVVKIGARS